MKKLIPLSVMATMAIIGAAYGQSAPGQSGQSGQSTPAAQSKGAPADVSQSRASDRAGNRTESKRTTGQGRDVNVKIRTNTGPNTVVRRKSQRVTVTEDRSPSVTVVTKKKKFVKRKRAPVVVVAPPSRTTTVRTRRGVAVGPTVRTRTTIRSSVRQQPSVNVNMRSRTQTRTDQKRTTTGSGGGHSQDSGQIQKQAPAQGGGGGQGQGASGAR